jgi:hypothetical protein
MRILNKENIDAWLNDFDKELLSEHECKQLVEFLEVYPEYDTLMNDEELQLKVNPIQTNDKVLFTNIAKQAAEDLELLAFDIAEKQIAQDELVWLDELKKHYPSLENDIQLFEKVHVKPNAEIVFPNKKRLKKGGKLISLFNPWISTAAMILLVLGISFNWLTKSSMYQPRLSTITITPWETPKIEEQVLEEKIENNHEVISKPFIPKKEVIHTSMDNFIAVIEKIPQEITNINITRLKSVVKPQIEAYAMELFTVDPPSQLELKLASLKNDLNDIVEQGKVKRDEIAEQPSLLRNQLKSFFSNTAEKLKLKQPKLIRVLGTNIVLEPIASVK